MFRQILVGGLLLANIAAAQAEHTKIDDLTATVMGLDAALFAAYNTCDLTKMAAMVSEDLEFYHDQSGLMHGRAPFIEAIKKNICGKARRDVDTSTIEVFPLKGYGAVEMGTHTFCQTDASGTCKSAKGPARFVQLWQHRDGRWLLTRVISYDHH